MNAPVKIYVTPIRTWDTKPIPDLQDNIYICKDALLDWLKAVKADVMIPMNIDRVIAKIESL